MFLKPLELISNLIIKSLSLMVYVYSRKTSSETSNFILTIFCEPFSIKVGVKNWFLVLKDLPFFVKKSMSKLELLEEIRLTGFPK